MTWTVNAITLATVNSAELTKTDSGVTVLTLQGSIYSAGSTKAQLVTDYVTPLLAAVAIYEEFAVDGAAAALLISKGGEIIVDSPGDRYDGYYVLRSAVFTEVSEGAVVRFTFALTLVQGSSHVLV